jgi:hypothetical protein
LHCSYQCNMLYQQICRYSVILCTATLCVCVYAYVCIYKVNPSYNIICSSASCEILCILWKRKFQCHVYNSHPLVSILSQINPLYALL